MIKKLFILSFSLITLSLNAQTKADSVSILLAVDNYLQGWNTGDSTRMDMALHPALVKRIVQNDSIGNFIVNENTKESMIHKTATKKKNPVNPNYYTVKILDIYSDIASVRTETKGFIDYIHLVKINSDWKIINVLWAKL